MTGSKTIASGTLAASAASTIQPVIFVKFQFDGGNVNLHTELGDISFGGDTYTGAGKLAAIGAMEENSDLSRTPISLTLSGLPNDIISILLGQQYQGRLATLFLGYLDLTTRTLVDTPMILYRGNIDTADFQIDKNCSITLSVESRFAAWDKPLTRRYNNSDQQSRFPGDKGLQFIEQTADKTIFWGAADAMKIEGWEGLLTAHIEQAYKSEFQWGKNDCALWCAEWVRLATGNAIADEWEGLYSTEAELNKIMAEEGFASVADIANKYGSPVEIAFAQRGDIVLHPQGCLGICNGLLSHFLTEDGLTRLNTLRCPRAWRVE